MKKFAAVLVALSFFLQQTFAADPAEFPVTIHVDAAQPRGELTPIWRFFGYDEANYTYMTDGKKLLTELSQLGAPQVYIRCHHLLTSGDGAPALKWSSTGIYSEDTNGNPIYNWTIVDRIFDTYLERGLKPYAQLGFMPEALSTHPQDYPHDPPANERAPVEAGQAYPPKDYAKWGELAYQWTKHCVEKYGAGEVAKWYWEVWNEPNIGYWHGSHADYFRLYDYAVAGVRRALPSARVGGPETAGGPGGKFLREFLEHCARGTNYVDGKIGAPLDFISFHAKGSPVFTNDHVRMGMANQFRNINDAFAVIASFPEYKKTPIVIGESDPEGCAACREPRDAYRNGTMYSSYTAASFPREYDLAAEHGVNLLGALTWAFEFEDQPYFAGFRALASHGLDLPVLNVFRMFSKMSGQRIAVTSSAGFDAQTIRQHGIRETPDVSAFAALDTHQLTVLTWHYHDDDVAGPEAAVALKLDHLPASVTHATLTQYRIDNDHANSYTAWQRLGSPQEPTPEQYAQLEKAGKLTAIGAPEKITTQDGRATIQLKLPRQAVALLVLKWD
ncbi:MAG TPA: beta-xylosidase [Verrucomicrobiae bacterium]|jgi:xylan 1,4-beta-xylosidase|nr:beta-xylosidase [Verrucomicrobiae bacterium]HEX4264178.1 beta-xylosidase [Verrucomicrobiae bacterium]